MRPRQARLRATVAVVALASAVLAGCGSSGPTRGGAAGSSDGALIWAVSGGADTVYKQSAERFNADHEQQVSVQTFQNDPMKQKLRVAMGACNPPDLFFGWGGGILSSYVDAGDVEDLTPYLRENPDVRDKFLPNVMSAVTFDGKTYGLPLRGVQPVLLFYNRDVFREHGVQPPKTWQELVDLVPVFTKAGVTPLALGGASRWPNLMYEEYLVDRIGGPEPFNQVLAGKKDAWSHPAFLEANRKIQDLVKAGAFGEGFAPVNYDTGQQSALLYTGKAAMEVMGGWEFANILTNQPQFIEDDKLGWTSFPTVEGGAGDPEDVVGNPSNFYSLTTKSEHKDAAKAYLGDSLMDDKYVDQLIELGDVPPVKGIEGKLAESEHADWLGFVYDEVRTAQNFQLSWDQALPPKQAEALLNNLDQLFLEKITPEQFSENMNRSMQ